jgi:Winged helix DNA-binding domain
LAAEAAVTAERCAAQLLCGPAAGRVEEVAARLLAIQAQDPRGARLTFRSRSAGLSAADVDDALARRSVVVSWLNRGTLHLVLAEDYWWLHPLTAPQVSAGNARRLAQEGVPPDDAERGVAAVTAALTADGPLTRSQLRERVAAAGVRTEGQALVHVLLLASIRGLIVRGPVAGREQAFVLTRDWLGAPPPLDRETALGELARRYLAGHAPANDRDLAKWAGIGLREARAGLARAGAAERPDGLAELPGQRRAAGAALPPPRLLGAFDPLLLGWASRDPVVGPHRQIVTVNGLFRPFALVAGRAVATWGLAGGQVTLAPFGPLDAATRVALEAEAADVTRFLGLLPAAVFTVQPLPARLVAGEDGPHRDDVVHRRNADEVPGQAVLRPVDGDLAVELDRIVGDGHLRHERHRAGAAADGQGPRDLHAVAGRAGAVGGEGEVRVVVDVEEVGRAQVLVPAGVAGVERPGADGDGAGHCARRVDRAVAADLAEDPAQGKQAPGVPGLQDDLGPGPVQRPWPGQDAVPQQRLQRRRGQLFGQWHAASVNLLWTSKLFC